MEQTCSKNAPQPPAIALYLSFASAHTFQVVKLIISFSHKSLTTKNVKRKKIEKAPTSRQARKKERKNVKEAGKR